jgi:type VI secretion system protein ImpB
MAKNESVQKRLQKVRAPRVQMTYDVEIGDAIENKELPFVVGVLGDFGTIRRAEEAPEGPQVRQRRRRQFRRGAGRRGPRDELPRREPPVGEGGEFAVQLQFREMADFRPEAVVQQVAPLKGLLEARTKLADLRNKLAGNDKLEDILNDVLNTEKLGSLRKGGGRKEE